MQSETKVLSSSILPPSTSRYRAEAVSSKIFCFSNSESAQLSFMWNHDLSLSAQQCFLFCIKTTFLPGKKAIGITEGSTLPFKDISHQRNVPNIPADDPRSRQQFSEIEPQIWNTTCSFMFTLNCYLKDHLYIQKGRHEHTIGRNKDYIAAFPLQLGKQSQAENCCITVVTNLFGRNCLD